MSTINFGGLASGIDTEGIIEALMEVARQPIRTIETKKAAFSKKASAYATLSSQLSQLRTAAEGMDTGKELRTLTATSADETKLTAVASSSASPGAYALQINNLAQAERTYSDPFAAKDSAGLFGAGTLTIQVGSGTPAALTIDAADTLETVVEKINSAGIAASASIVFDGSQYRVVVMGEDTGAANGIIFTEGGTLSIGLDVPANEAQAALDASVTLDGITFASATNQLTEMIPGLTINLHDTTGAGTVMLSVAMDGGAMADKVASFVDKYNEIASFLHKQFQYTGAARADTLMGEAAARSVKARLQEIVVSAVPGLSGAHTMLSSVGIRTTSDGTLGFDSTAFQAALASDPAGVVALFTHDDGDAGLDEDGVAMRLTNALAAMLQQPDGLVPSRQEGLSDSIDAASDRIAELERRLDSYEETLRRQFTAMESAMAQFQSMSTFLSQQ